jgi:hypothetical protein
MSNPSLGITGSAPLENPLYLESRYLTRHGLIAGSTGTGKSRAMQLLAEQLADDSVNVFVSDVKGDASGFCVEGETNERNRLAPFKPHAIKANYWSASDALCPMRFSLDEIGPVLFSRLLDLNATQESHLALAFSFARKNKIPLERIDDLLDVFESMVKNEERGIAKSSVAVIERKLLSLQESGLDKMFGKPSIQLDDLNGLNVLNLSDSRNNMLVSIAPAFLLQKLFNLLPEVGDVEQPKYAIFFDEAHYLFKDANKSLRDLIVTILKQIRSKGVSIFFVTQDVSDLPDEILSQLSTKIIFAQRIASAKGESDLRALAKAFPKSSDMDIAEELKSLAPGIAIVSSLDEKGNQSKPVKVTMFAPATIMQVVDYETLREETDQELIEKYGKMETRKGKTKLEAKKAVEKNPAEVTKKKTIEIIKETKVVKKGPTIWDGIFAFLLKLLDFVIKALGKIANAVIIKPVQGLFKWLTKKPIRILWLILLVVIIYALFVNWPFIQGLLASLKIS